MAIKIKQVKKSWNGKNRIINKRILQIRSVSKVVATQKLSVAPLFVQVFLIIFAK